MSHPALAIPYPDLLAGLKAEVAKGNVFERMDETGLLQFCYTKACVYDKQWNEFTILARGLILDTKQEKVAALVFPKFFNVGEQMDNIPDLPFETYEKLDGSLIIIFWNKGHWRCATKGNLNSDQAKWASSILQQADISLLDKGTTYLAEAIYPENRIVVQYDYSGLVFLAAYDAEGVEVSYDSLKQSADAMNWRIVKRHSYSHISELLAKAQMLPATEEGFVLRFTNGLRLKIKGDEYCRIHRLVSNLTPLAMWEAMLANDNLEAIRRQLPEEFWTDFDLIIALLERNRSDFISSVIKEVNSVAHLSDKEVGLKLDTFPERTRHLIFPYRKSNGDLMSPKLRDGIYKAIRPNANNLPGYAPSYAINRVMEEI